jgi:signal transduction histidine kinase
VLELGRDLAELCREHGLGPELVEGEPRPEEILERAIDAWERRSRDAAGLSASTRLELQGLAKLAREARSLQAGSTDGAGAPDAEQHELLDQLASLCHKINNPLTSLMGRTQILSLKVRADAASPFAKEAHVIGESSARIAAAVAELAQLINDARSRLPPRS